MAAEGGDDNHLSTPCGCHIAADNIFRSVITAFEDDVRLQCCDEVQRRVLFKDGHPGNHGQAGYDGGALKIGLYRSVFTLQPLDRCVAV